MLYEAELTQRIIGAAIEVHRHLGAGLLKSGYEECLAHELTLQGIPVEKEKPLPVKYKGVLLDCGSRLDFSIAGKVILELKAVAAIEEIHEAQLLTYLRPTGCKIGFIINFNVSVLRHGIKRMVL